MKIPSALKGLFSPKYMQNIDTLDLMSSLNSEVARKIWLFEIYEELKNMNLAVEKALLSGDHRINDLSARRKAFQDVLEMILRAKTRVAQEKDPAPRFQTEVDLDRRTV